MHPILFHIGSLLIPSYGACAALGVLLALLLLRRTAIHANVDPSALWNLAVIALFVAIAGSRLLLVFLNFTLLRSHPAWFLSLAMIHHPLLAGIAALLAFLVVIPYALLRRIPLRSAADAFAAPVALGLAFEQFGALLAASGFGTQTNVPWAVVYKHPLASRWSGAPLFTPVHPVQAYSCLGFLVVAAGLTCAIRILLRAGESAGVAWIAIGTVIYFTEFFRDPEGRGAVFSGLLDLPQCAAIVFVLVGALLLVAPGPTQASPAQQSAGHLASDSGAAHG